MSRRRYLSTDISLDARINRLAIEAGDFAALLFTWLIPHAEDDCSLPADPEELLFKVLPGRRDKVPQDVEQAIQKMMDAGLLQRVGERIIFPPEAFYRYQTYIPVEKRRTAKNSAKRRTSAKNASSPSPSPSPSPKEETPNPLKGNVDSIISQINALSGKAYKPESKAVLKGLVARLRDGASAEDCLLVVEDRWNRWKDRPEMLEHFNPVTLFRPGHFEKYLTEAKANGNGAETLEARMERLSKEVSGSANP